MNRQGADEGTQYRSIILYENSTGVMSGVRADTLPFRDKNDALTAAKALAKEQAVETTSAGEA